VFESLQETEKKATSGDLAGEDGGQYMLSKLNLEWGSLSVTVDVSKD
jgi:hypothetical protein